MELKKGDTVTRYLSSKRIPMELTVWDIDDKYIYLTNGTLKGKDNCWKFDRTFGYEVDEFLGWGKQVGGPRDGEVVTGSFIELPDASETVVVQDPLEIAHAKLEAVSRRQPPAPESVPPASA